MQSLQLTWFSINSPLNSADLKKDGNITDKCWPQGCIPLLGQSRCLLYTSHASSTGRAVRSPLSLSPTRLSNQLLEMLPTSTYSLGRLAYIFISNTPFVLRFIKVNGNNRACCMCSKVGRAGRGLLLIGRQSTSYDGSLIHLKAVRLITCEFPKGDLMDSAKCINRKIAVVFP